MNFRRASCLPFAQALLRNLRLLRGEGLGIRKLGNLIATFRDGRFFLSRYVQYVQCWKQLEYSCYLYTALYSIHVNMFNEFGFFQ